MTRIGRHCSTRGRSRRQWPIMPRGRSHQAGSCLTAGSSQHFFFFWGFILVVLGDGRWLWQLPMVWTWIVLILL